MAMKIKQMLVEALVQLCQTTPLEMITIKQLLDKTGMSRQTFYNHFTDKNDLIQYTYDTMIVPDFNDTHLDMKFSESLLIAFERMKQYHYFLKPACKMEGQNNLKDYIFEHCKEFDLKWHQSLYGLKEMPETLRFATIYHATASSSMTLSWILSDMPVSCVEITKMIVEMRGIGMEALFQDGETKGNPYQ